MIAIPEIKLLNSAIDCTWQELLRTMPETWTKRKNSGANYSSAIQDTFLKEEDLAHDTFLMNQTHVPI
jgi:hypothetical protein